MSLAMTILTSVLINMDVLDTSRNPRGGDL